MFLSNAINNIETDYTVKLSVPDSVGMFRCRVADQPSIQLITPNSIFDNTARLIVAEDSMHNFSSLVNVNDTSYMSTTTSTGRVRELERRIEELERMVQRGGHNNAS